MEAGKGGERAGQPRGKLASPISDTMSDLEAVSFPWPWVGIYYVALSKNEEGLVYVVTRDYLQVVFIKPSRLRNSVYGIPWVLVWVNSETRTWEQAVYLRSELGEH